MSFDFSSQLILENERALLRPLTENDVESLLYFSENEPSLWEYSLQTAAGEHQLKAYISNALADRAIGKAYPFLVFDKQSEEVAGCTRFYDINFYHKCISIGFTWYGEAFQRTGLNRQCKLLLLSHAFEELGMERVEFRADARNQRSIEAMLALGCVMEGTLRSNCRAGEGRRDSVVLSILKAEWEKGGKEALKAKTH